MKFVKMHGCGNDYVYLDAVTEPSIEARIGAPGWVELVGKMSDRHKGIGSDGVIVVCRPTDAAQGAQVRMRMFNADGSESEMCGNGVRCVAKFAHDRLGVDTMPMLVETGRGVLAIEYVVREGKVVEATVDMGEPILDLAQIPVNHTHLARRSGGHEHEIVVGKLAHPAVFVSMGNPHAVIFESLEPGVSAPFFDDLSRWRTFVGRSHFEITGRQIEHHAAFPNRINVHWAKCVDDRTANALTWERGSGITQACGTGVCAVLVAGVLTGRLARDSRIKVLGGSLRIQWDEKTNRVFMTGEAVDVCEGVWLGDF